MQMEIILNDGQGESILLPRELALDEWEVGKEIPGATLPGKDGRVVYKHLQRKESTILRASGTIEYFNKEEADQHAAELRSKLIRDEPYWLKRYDGADRFIRVRCTKVHSNPHRGRFRGRLHTLTITFQADDPFWYSSDLVQIERDIVFTPPITMLDIANGGEELVYPTIWIVGKTSGSLHTKNPKFTNYTTGQVLAFSGEIKQGETLIFNTAKKKATFIGRQMLQSGTARSGTSGGIQLATSASANDDEYKNCIVKIMTGAGAGEYRRILGYNGATKVAVVEPAWTVAPNATSTYEIYHPSWLDGYHLYEAQTYGGASGVNVTNKVNAGFLVDSFPLAPGLNRVEVEDDNNLLALKILFRKRWQ